MASVYRMHVPSPPEMPPSCQCWLIGDNRAILNCLGGAICTDQCEDYRRRHPEMVLRKADRWWWAEAAVELKFGKENT